MDFSPIICPRTTLQKKESFGTVKLPGTYEPFKVGARIMPRKGIGVEYLKVPIFNWRFKGFFLRTL